MTRLITRLNTPQHDVVIYNGSDGSEVWLEPQEGSFAGVCIGDSAKSATDAVQDAIDSLSAAIDVLKSNA